MSNQLQKAFEIGKAGNHVDTSGLAYQAKEKIDASVNAGRNSKG